VTQFKIAINRLWPGEKLPPRDPRWGQYTHSFKPETHTIESFTEALRRGYAFSPVMKGNYRLKDNFLSCQHMVLDWDGDKDELIDPEHVPVKSEDSRIENVLQDPFIQEHAALVYTTPSHQEDWKWDQEARDGKGEWKGPRCRIVFILSEPISDVDQADKTLKAMVEKYPQSDQTVGEAARFLYGMGPDPKYVILGNVIDIELAKSFIPPETTRKTRTYTPGTYASSFKITDLIQQFVPRRVRKTSNKRSAFTMRCPGQDTSVSGLCTVFDKAESDSFTVDAADQLWHCFACDGQGNAWQLFKILAPPEIIHAEELSRRHSKKVTSGAASERKSEVVSVSSNNLGKGIKDWLEIQKNMVVAYLYAEADRASQSSYQDKLKKARNLEHCFEHWKQQECQNTGETFAKRYRCGLPICPLCSIWLIDGFLTKHEDALKRVMEDGGVYYKIKFPSRELLDADRGFDAIKTGYKTARGMLSDLTDKKGKSWQTAKDLVYGFNASLLDGQFYLELNIWAPREAGAHQMLKDWFSGAVVEAWVNDGLRAGIERFRNQMAMRVEFNDARSYEVWRLATKNSRLIQGKGSILHKISGQKVNQTPQERAEKARKKDGCPICGVCTPVTLALIHVSKAKTETRTSPFTGINYTFILEVEEAEAEHQGQEVYA